MMSETWRTMLVRRMIPGSLTAEKFKMIRCTMMRIKILTRLLWQAMPNMITSSGSQLKLLGHNWETPFCSHSLSKRLSLDIIKLTQCAVAHILATTHCITWNGLPLTKQHSNSDIPASHSLLARMKTPRQQLKTGHILLSNAVGLALLQSALTVL